MFNIDQILSVVCLPNQHEYVKDGANCQLYFIKNIQLINHIDEDEK